MKKTNRYIGIPHGGGRYTLHRFEFGVGAEIDDQGRVISGKADQIANFVEYEGKLKNLKKQPGVDEIWVLEGYEYGDPIDETTVQNPFVCIFGPSSELND